MQLTEKAIQCQELGADKTLSFGCLVKDEIKYKTISYIFDDFGSFHNREIPDYYWVEFANYSGNVSTGRIKECCTIIGHQLNRGRLEFLYRSIGDTRERLSVSEKRNKYIDLFHGNPDLYNQTILDRQHNNELMDLILEFLLSLK